MPSSRRRPDAGRPETPGFGGKSLGLGTALVIAGLVIAGLVVAAPPAAAQLSGGRSAGARHRHGGAAAPTANPADEPQQKPPPRQRLEAGALLCSSEAALNRHEQAVEARLDGQDAPEPGGCHFITAMTPVSVVERHGLASTAVRLAGPPEQVGWTDAIVARAP